MFFTFNLNYLLLFFSSSELTSDTFAPTETMSAHNLAFVAGELEMLGELAPGVQHWAISSTLEEFYLKNKFELVIKAYNELFRSVQRPIEKLDVAALPVDTDGLSSPGLIVMRYAYSFFV